MTLVHKGSVPTAWRAYMASTTAVEPWVEPSTSGASGVVHVVSLQHLRNTKPLDVVIFILVMVWALGLAAKIQPFIYTVAWISDTNKSLSIKDLSWTQWYAHQHLIATYNVQSSCIQRGRDTEVILIPTYSTLVLLLTFHGKTYYKKWLHGKYQCFAPRYNK